MTSPANDPIEPTEGAPVWTADGVQFGYVKEIKGGYFKLDVPMARDYWLSNAYIAEATPEKVSLTLRQEELDEHRLSAPGLEGQEPNTTESVISDTDMLAQRERMERELEIQREKMRAGLR